MDVFLATGFKILLVAATAPWWFPVLREIVRLVQEAAADAGPDAPSPVHVDQSRQRQLYDDRGDSTWSKTRRVNRRWDSGR